MLNQQEEIGIHEAVSSGNIGLVREILKRDPTCVNDWNNSLQTPLYLACMKSEYYENNGESMMELLIDCGADVNINVPFSIHSVLSEFMLRKTIYCDVNKLDLLLKNHIDLNIPNFLSDTALSSALGSAKNNILCSLLVGGANCNIINEKGIMPLDVAIKRLSLSLLKLLINQGAKSQKIYENLLETCEMSYDKFGNRMHILNLLLKNIETIDAYGQFSPKTLMHLMVSKKHHVGEKNCYLARWLLKQGIKVESGTGDSDLHQAVRIEDNMKIEKLLEHKADVNVKNFYGDTPLHVLLQIKTYQHKKYDRIINLLIEHGADLNARNCQGDRPFEIAVTNEKMSFINLVLTKITGFHITAENNTLDTNYSYNVSNIKDNIEFHELIVAISLGYEQVVNRLLEINYGNLSKKCSQGANTALNLAVCKGQFNILKMLLEAGFQADKHFTSDLPIWYLKIDHKRMICLLWEYKDYVTLNRITTETLNHFIFSFIHDIDFLCLLIMYYAIDSRLNQLNPDLIPMKGLFKVNENLSHILGVINSCLNEFKKFVFSNVSLYDILTMQLNSLVKLLSDENFYNEVIKFYRLWFEKRKFLCYIDYVGLMRFQLAVERKNILKTAISVLNEAFESVLALTNFEKLPDEIMENIIMKLDLMDIKKISARN